MNSQIFFAIVTIFTFQAIIVSSIPVPQHAEQYSPAEKLALKKFRELIAGDELPQDYMNTDAFLINWIRSSKQDGIRRSQNQTSYSVSIGPDFDLKKAVKNLEKTLAWRRDENIDGILDEDFSDLEQELEFDLTRHDKNGRPLFVVDFAKWDLKKATEADPSTQARFARYLDYMLEKAAAKARELQTSDYTYLVDVGGWTKETHGCPKCLDLYPYFVSRFETHYPHMTKNLLYVNAPPEFDVAAQEHIVPHLAPNSKQGLQTFGDNKEEWLAEVGKIIDYDQIPAEFVEKVTTTTTTTTTPKPPKKFVWYNSCAGCGVVQGN